MNDQREAAQVIQTEHASERLLEQMFQQVPVPASHLRPIFGSNEYIGERTMEQISYGVAECGHAGQIFKTGKCAHCYIAELEADVLRLADRTLAIGQRPRCATEGHVWVGQGDEGAVVCDECGIRK